LTACCRSASRPPEWTRAADEVRRRYLGDDFESEVATFTVPARDHRSILVASPFCDIESVVGVWERRLTAEQVVGPQFSYSVSTPLREGFDTTFRALISEIETTRVDREVLALERPTMEAITRFFATTDTGRPRR
jgi:hypothetical protein